MYKVYCDNHLLYHSKLENLQIFNPSLELELNKTGSFETKIYPNHPRYGLIKRMKSIITVYQDDYLLFRGRVLDEEAGWHNQKAIKCEGELAFLLDSIQRPYNFTGSIKDFLSMLITNHNAMVEEEKHFTLGNVTVTDPNDYIVRSDIEYTNTWDVITKKLIDMLGGYIIVRHEGGKSIIDYLSEVTLLAQQKIRFGRNLLDLKRIRKGSEIKTSVIPLGAKLKNEEGQDTDQRLTIADVNGGLDYLIDEDAIGEHTTIFTTVIFDDVTDPNNLLTKGKAEMARLVNLPDSIELTAADLATVDKTVTSFHLGTMVDVESNPHGINSLFLVSKLSIKLFDPAANRLTLGKVLMGFSEAVKGLSDGQGVILQVIEQTAERTSEAIYNVEQNFQASIQAESDNIRSSVAENYYLKDDTDALISSVSTAIEQTQNSVEIQFNQFSADIAAVAAGTDAEFEEIRKYIRFVDGKILLGEVGNELELEIANDRISFLQDGAEVAYFSNRKLYVTDTEILHSLQLGNFAYMPRANGNLSFKKI